MKNHLLKIYRPVATKFRRMTWSHRVSPGLIIAGAQKAGTTSLFNYLSQHPQMIPSLKKEVHYYDGGLGKNIDNYKKGESWYRSNFPLKILLNNSSVAFEASPYYLYHPLVPKRLFDDAPDSKIVILLRNPAERAISHYFHELRNGTEKLPMLEAFKAEEERLRPLLDSQQYNSIRLNQQSYLSRGKYLEQLERYFQYFDKKNILVISSESFFCDPQAALKKVYKLACVDAGYLATNLKPMNVGANKSGVATETVDYLNNFFEQPNRDLYRALKQDFQW